MKGTTASYLKNHSNFRNFCSFLLTLYICIVVYNYMTPVQNSITTERKTTGFASPAQGYEEEGIDFNRLIIQNPASTFVYRLNSEELTGLGIPRQALLVIDFSLKPVYNSLVLIRHGGSLLPPLF